MQQFDDAIGYYQAALAIAQEAGDRHREGEIHYNLGTAYQAQWRFDDAIGYYQAALAIFRETGDRYNEGQILGNLGAAYQDLQQPGRAAACRRDAAAAMRDAGDHEHAARLEQLAVSTGPGGAAGGAADRLTEDRVVP